MTRLSTLVWRAEHSATQVLVTEPSRAEAYAVYPYYAIGLGGLCNDLFTPNASFWCNPR